MSGSAQVGLSAQGVGQLGVARLGVAGFGGGIAPPVANLDQWLKTVTPDGLTLPDTIGTLSDPAIVDVSCLISSGAQTISNAAIANGAVVTNLGTAIGTATAGVITFTAGTISNVSLDGVLTYVCEEHSGLPLDVSGAGNHITSMTTTRTTTDGIPSRNRLMGHTPAVVSDASGQYIDLNVII